MESIKVFSFLYCALFCLCCSIQNKDKLFEKDKEKLILECKEMLESDQRYRLNSDMNSENFQNLQYPIDVMNTKKLLRNMDFLM